MNIFILDLNPIVSAEKLFKIDKKRALKQIIEDCQILSNVLHYNNVDAPYKKTHFNHPVCTWSRENTKHFEWLVVHCETLLKNYTEKFHKIHKCYYVLQSIICSNIYLNRVATNYDNIEFVNCARNKSLGLDFTHIKHIPTAYKEYLKARKYKIIEN